MTMKLKMIVAPGAELPQYATEGSAGFDLKVTSVLQYTDALMKMNEKKENGFTIAPLSRILVGTGLFPEVPAGYEIQIRPRSGMCLKQGITVLNSPGTIDSDYRGEIGIILYNSSNTYQEITFGERVAQGVLTVVERALFEKVSVLSETERADGGFGHTGK